MTLAFETHKEIARAQFLASNENPGASPNLCERGAGGGAEGCSQGARGEVVCIKSHLAASNAMLSA